MAHSNMHLRVDNQYMADKCLADKVYKLVKSMALAALVRKIMLADSRLISHAAIVIVYTVIMNHVTTTHAVASKCLNITTENAADIVHKITV